VQTTIIGTSIIDYTLHRAKINNHVYGLSTFYTPIPYSRQVVRCIVILLYTSLLEGGSMILEYIARFVVGGLLVCAFALVSEICQPK